MSSVRDTTADEATRGNLMDSATVTRVVTRTGVATVIVADDHAVVRAGVRHILDGMPDVTIVAEASNAAGAVEIARRHVPDLVMLDVSMPGGSGIGVLGAIREACPNARILMLSVHDDREYLEESIRSGAHGYLLKDTAATDLRSAVAALLDGREYFSPGLGSAPDTPPPPRITTRERQVLVRVAAGMTSKQIAGELGISPRTVETHRESLTRKLGISSVAGLTRYALEQGIRDDG
jgi:two-component system nitrate/nitrite response regulator NarL